MKKRKQEDWAQFSALYDEFMPRIYRYLFCRLGNRPLTEDLTSTVFEKAAANYGAFNRRRASFYTWVFAIARNTLIDYYRANGDKESCSLDAADELPSKDLVPQEIIERDEDNKRLHLRLSVLPEIDREIIQLKYGARFTNREIAKLLGMSESNVGTRHERALKKLRVALEEPVNDQ